MDSSVAARAAVHAALGDPVRLAIVDELASSDRSPSELAEQFDLPANLLAHHLGVLDDAGLVDRVVSSGDRRRRYLRLRPEGLAPGTGVGPLMPTRVVFVCTHNSARSQLAAALWARATGERARSAGTEPADRVHPKAVAAADRSGLDLSKCAPRLLSAHDLDGALVVTVCDRAHEQLDPAPDWWHWSIPDPVEAGTRRAFDLALAQIEDRVRAVSN